MPGSPAPRATSTAAASLHFAFPGVSGPPGTADVTTSLFSSRRGDGVFNPKPIPDLAADPPKVSRDPASAALRAFIRGLIVEEFDGLEPPAAVLDGLAAYVRALRGPCGGDAPRTATSEAGEAMGAVEAAEAALLLRDVPTAHLLIAAARSSLGRLDERFAGLPGADRLLAAGDAGLLRIQALAETDPAAARQALGRWRMRFARDLKGLAAAEPRSLYAPATLDRVLAVTR